jgi:EAL and modified HD-GYP domain-containing signal transduction protein
MIDVFVGRHAIYNRELEVIAYELLFRGSAAAERAEFQDADEATSRVILSTFTEIGLDRIVEGKMAFINLTRSFVLGDYPLPLSKAGLGLEILENISIDQPVIEAVQRLSTQGYTIVLDDFIYHESLRPLVEIADIIKIDMQALPDSEVQRHVEILRKHTVKLLAEKVETHEQFEFCNRLGFDYFQGFFFCQPHIVKGQRIPPNRLVTLRLLAKLQDPVTSIRELETLISQDVSMSYKLLRSLNSAFYSLPRKIESVHQALVMLGNQWLKTWASLLLLSSIHDKPQELMQIAMVRAKMCELLATAKRLGAKEIFFTTGLFSVLDALMDQPMEDVLNALPLSQEINDALLRREGNLGVVLQCVLDYERGNWDAVQHIGLQQAEITQAYLEAIAWATQVSKETRVKTTH